MQISEIIQYATAPELTISSGAITITQGNHKLQPQSGTTDDLDTINGTSAGQFGTLYASDFGTDTITIKHNTGNILCMGGSDISLSYGCVFWYSNGTKVFMSGGGGGTVEATGENLLINGTFEYAQHNATPGTLTAYADDAYAADGWYILTDGGATDIQYARVAGDTNSPYAGQIKQVNASAKRMGLAQIIESKKSIPRRSKDVTFKVRVKSSTTPSIKLAILEWTGTADSVTSDVVNNWASGTFTPGNFFLSSNLTVTAVKAGANASTSYAEYSLSATLSSSCNNIIVMMWTENTVAQNVTVDFTQADLYVGTSTRAWSPLSSDAELTKCRRYCTVLGGGTGETVGVATYAGAAGENTYTTLIFPVEMFTVPTVTIATFAVSNTNQPTSTQGVRSLLLTITSLASGRYAARSNGSAIPILCLARL